MHNATAATVAMAVVVASTVVVAKGQYIEVHGVGHHISMHADWKVAGSGSLVFGNLQLTGPKKRGMHSRLL